MSLDKARDKFVASNRKVDITPLEKRYDDVNNRNLTQGTKEECNKISQDYHQSCEKSNVLSKVREFFDDGFVQKAHSMIANASSFKDLRVAIERYKTFNKIMRDAAKLEKGKEHTIEDIVITCISKRIEYKYRCLREHEKKDIPKQLSHNAEIVRHIFYHTKVEELYHVFRHLIKKYQELSQASKIQNKEYEEVLRKSKEKCNQAQEQVRVAQEIAYQTQLEYQQKEEEIRQKRQEEKEVQIQVLEEAFEDSPLYQQVMSKKYKKTSRKKKHRPKTQLNFE